MFTSLRVVLFQISELKNVLHFVIMSAKFIISIYYKPSAPPQSSGSAALPVPLLDKADIYMPGAIVTPTNSDMLAETWIV